MKKTYLIPSTDVVLVSSSAIMITASDGTGQKIVDDGGDTSTEGITEGDSRRHINVWGDEEEEEEY